MYLRFANAMFEPIWSREHVASIQITMAEDFGVDGSRRVLRPASARYATSSRTTFCRCSHSSRWSRQSGDHDAIPRRRDGRLPCHAERQPARGGVRPVRRLPRRSTASARAPTPRPSSRSGSRSRTGAGPASRPRPRRQSAPRDGDRDRHPAPARARAPVRRAPPRTRPATMTSCLRIGRHAGMSIYVRAKTPGKEVSQPVSLDSRLREELGEPPQTVRAAARGCAPRRSHALPAMGA